MPSLSEIGDLSIITPCLVLPGFLMDTLLKECTEKCDSDPNTTNLEELNSSVFRRNMIVCMITSHKVPSFVLGQLGTNSAREITNIFLNPENSNKKKSTLRKVFNREGKLTTYPKQIMNELEAFYSDLYDAGTCADMGSFPSF